MRFTREQLKEAYKRLSPEMYDFVLGSETADIIEQLLQKCNLSSEQATLADSEILYTMLGLQTLSDAIGNIAKLSNRSVENFVQLKKDLEENILQHIVLSSNAIAQNNPIAPTQSNQPQRERQNSVGTSFEEAILNQAKAMRPAVASSSEQLVVSSKVPDNSHGSVVSSKEEGLRKIHDYPKDQDPYREPLG